MKFEKKGLHEALKVVAPFAGVFPVKQVLFGVEKEVPLPVIRLVFGSGSLVLEAVNRQASIHLSLLAEGKEEHSYCLPVKPLLEAVGMADGDLQLTHSESGLCVKSGTGKTTIKQVGEEAVPPLVGSEAFTALGVSNQEVARGIGMVAGAASQDAARPALRGVQVEMMNGSLVFAATDGFRLAVCTLQTPVKENYAFLLPIEAVSGLVGCLSKQEGEARVVVTETQAIFALGEGFVAAQLVDGRFPDWRQIIPKSHKARIVFDSALAAAIKTAKVVARESSLRMPSIALAVGENKVTVRSQAEEVGSSTVEVTPASISGEMGDTEIVFNANLIPLAEIGEGAEIALNGAKYPALWTNGKEGWQYLLMPVEKR